MTVLRYIATYVNKHNINKTDLHDILQMVVLANNKTNVKVQHYDIFVSRSTSGRFSSKYCVSMSRYRIYVRSSLLFPTVNIPYHGCVF